MLGQPPTPQALLQYLSAYFGTNAPPNLLQDVAAALPDDQGSLTALRQRLERAYAQPAAEGVAGEDAAVKATIDEALRIGTLLRQNTQEMDGAYCWMVR